MKKLAIPLVVLFCTGCMSSAALVFRDQPDRIRCAEGHRFGHVFMGTRLHLQGLRDDGPNLFLVDLPLSLAGDTLLLPITAPAEWKYYNQCKQWRMEETREAGPSADG